MSAALGRTAFLYPSGLAVRIREGPVCTYIAHSLRTHAALASCKASLRKVAFSLEMDVTF